MLRAFTGLRQYAVKATDGPAGRVKDLQFDDASWVVRHLVIDVGRWLPRRRFLVPTTAIQSLDAETRTCTLRLTKSEVQRSPRASAAPPVSRQHHMTFYDLKGLPHVSAGPDPHLRSARTVLGYVVLALDGEAGRVADLLVEDGTWRVRYLVVGSGKAGRSAPISPDWVKRMDGEEQAVHVDVYRGHIESAPNYDSSIPVTRDYEQRLHEHYGRPGYWHSLSSG